MAISQLEYTGNGAQTTFSITFEYAFTSEIIVEVDRVVKQLNTDYTFANATTIEFNTAPESGKRVLITRTTDIDNARAVFYPGSAIRANDLNSNFDQSRFSVQEWRDQKASLYNAVFPDRIDMDGHPIINVEDPTNAQDAATKNYVDTTTVASSGDTMTGNLNMGSNNIVNVAEPTSSHDAATKNYVDTTTWNVTDETIQSGETWVGSNAYVATTQSIDQRIDAKIDTAITNDIGTDGTGITVTDDGDGTITLGLADNSIDFDKIKGVDIITEAEQDAGSPAPSDSNLLTSLASSKRFDTIVSPTTPVGSDWEVGKTWFQNDANKTLSIWNGSAWIGITSGGTFTTQPTVIYVDAVNGDDNNDGHRIISPKRTIKNAVASASAGDIIYVVPGVYQESLPIDITVSNLSIVGQSIRSCYVHPTPATETETMFRCNSGTYISNFTFAGLKASGARGGHPVDSDATYGLPANQGWVAGFYPGAVIRKSPYIQNCTNFADSGINNSSFDPNNFAGTGGDLTSAPTGGGIFVDGSLPDASSPLRSIVVDSFTQICLDGPGCLVANNGYAQLVSFFGTFCHYHTKALSGGQANLTNSTTDFGRYGLIADGKSTTAIFTATANGAASAGDITFAINQPVDNWFGSATRPLDNMLVQIGSDIYEILSSSPNGLGWNVTISRPDPANRAVNLGLINSHANGAAISFFLQSFVSTSGHTFEYAGTGTDYRALPQNGGVAIEANQVISRNDGRVWLSSTDQNGKFKVGDTFAVDQRTGFVTIDPQSVATNVVSDLSPQLGGDLDVLNRRIYTSLANGDIDLDANASGLIKVTEYNLSQVPIVTQHDVGEDPNQVPLNYMLGTMAYQNADYIDVGSANIDLIPTATVNLGTAAAPSITFTGDTNTGIYSPGGDQVAISTGGTQRAMVDSSGRLLVGTSTGFSTNFSGIGLLQIAKDSNNAAQIFAFSSVGQDYPAALELGRGRGTKASPSTALNGDWLGSVEFLGHNGTAFQPGARIFAVADAEWNTAGSTSDTPARLVFATTADGANLPTERMRITNDGYLRLAGAGIQFNGDTAAANALDDYEEGTWTPTLGGNTTYVYQEGTYTKIGNVVTARFRIGVNTLGTGSNSQISGLPFSSAGVGTGHIGYFTNIATSLSFIAIYIDPLAPTVASLYNATGSAVSLVLNPVFQNNTLVMGTVVYRST